jgi:hypothetical protein
MVARQMYAQGVCSRLTTLRKLEELLENEIILDMKVKEKAFASLEINHNYPWEELAISLLTSSVEQIKSSIYGLSKNQKADNILDSLSNDLKKQHFKLKQMLKQMQDSQMIEPTYKKYKKERTQLA